MLVTSDSYTENPYDSCTLCPRSCRIDRHKRAGICGASDVLRIGRAALHWWEEPCLVGDRGSGAIFFSHCALGCVYCQNKELAAGSGVEVSPERLGEIIIELQNDQHAANINLVTASHYAPTIAQVLRGLKTRSSTPGDKQEQTVEVQTEASGCLRPAPTSCLTIPVVWNTSGYESLDTLELLDGFIEIYLVDFKYANPETAKRLSNARDYPEVALAAIEKMIDQVGEPVFNEKGYLKKGVIVRHLVLPGYVDDSLDALRTIHERFGNRALVSIMNQFTIVDPAFDYASFGLEREVSKENYERVLDFADSIGIEDYFWQEGGAASESFVPAFDGTGVACD